jgi:hypothetical protein
MIPEDQVEIVEMPEIKLVGLAMTSPFANHQPARVDAMKQQFYDRKQEIGKIIHPERFICPSFVSEVLLHT